MFSHFTTLMAQVVEIFARRKPGPIYREVSNIRRTKSQNVNVSRLIFYLSLPNPLKPGVKSRMKV